MKNFPAIIVTGTHVQLTQDLTAAGGDGLWPAGTVGIVDRVPDEGNPAYRVKLVDGTIITATRKQLALRKRASGESLKEILTSEEQTDFRKYIIYRCVVGSRAFGLQTEESDTDYRGIYLPPAGLHWSLAGVPEQLENEENQECFWELGKFIRLALKANPNILECLYTPLKERVEPIAARLIEHRERFLSKLLYQTYNGYALSQFKKMERDLRTHGQVRWKHAMHLIRLLLCGIHALKEGVIKVDVGDRRSSLLEIKNGEMSWEQLDTWRLELHRQFDAAFRSTALPDYPDYKWADDLLIEARKSMV